MLIDYISDLHIDTYRFDTSTFVQYVFKNKKANYLFIGGDISPFYKNIKDLLKELSPLYKKIFIVMGNHDLYQEIINNKHYNTFYMKYEFLKKELSFDNVIFLDGQLIQLEDKVISGLTMWYNYDYIKSKKLFDKYWFRFMLDSKETLSLNDSYDFYNYQIKKLEAIYNNKIDLFISHIKPLINEEFFEGKYRNSPFNTFFCFDGEKYIKNIKHWIFGHTHDKKQFKYKGTKFYSNPFGYPNENFSYTNIVYGGGFLEHIEI